MQRRQTYAEKQKQTHSTMTNATSKYQRLLAVLAETKGAVVAFSGGVDSTLLLHAAKQALENRAVAATISTPYVPRWELNEAKQSAERMQVRHVIVEMPFPDELRMNPPEHCYTCKKLLFGRLLETAGERGLYQVLDGTNVDDLGDYRPGIRALRELGITSPFLEADLNKQDIRELSKQFELPTWDKPSFACLLSRMPVDAEVTDQALRQVESAEIFLMGIGFPAVRVRHHGDVARIEIPQESIPDFIAACTKYNINDELKKLGYRHVTLDLGGYSMGSLNRIPAEQ
ncbi:ATP-dependent sacrificial sulfur transferase LarE [Maridesulfovibrio sp. FT414]|uniref:ATP-dependent sacrificial sulfur transferase LarE n=1 Tax=Maridesulfovibrio sp. FT414 TaxID=2979469 RepID=UPI003D80262F